MNHINATIDLLSAFFLLLLFISLFVDGAKKSKSRTVFIITAFVALFFILADSFSYLLDGDEKLTGLLYVLNTISFLGPAAIITMFNYYIFYIVGERKKANIWLARVVTFMFVADFFFILIASVTGNLFTIEHGVFVRRPLASYAPVVPGLMTVWILIMGFMRWGFIGTKGLISILGYVLVPAIAAVFEIFIPEYSFVYASFVFSIFLVYLMFQSGEIKRKAVREQVMQELLNVDPLTSLPNRRCYEETIKNFKSKDKVKVIFCDVNGLKFTNDTFGHPAGDHLLKRFSSMLKKHFQYETIFRISGDEFVIVIDAKDVRASANNITFFKEDILDNSSIASIGVAEGEGSDILKVVNQAEKMMYKDKKEYYEKTKRDRRS
ncbi:MAG: GGDEF domain-containing protein [Bacilli bacterium]|nr:GGDEF domain-containing protein [Bacilli bacterium]